MNHAIEVKGLCKSYGGNPAVNELDIAVPRGQVFGLLGANGAGKSTTIECMLGTRKAERGSISILSSNPHTDRKELFQKVGVQFQEANYQEKIKVKELCRVTQALYREPSDYEALLERFGIADKADSYVSELSSGQKQRLFIILALIANPEVVFLDELTTGLDTKARRSVWKCLSELKQNGLTIFLSSHFMDEVQALCDKICILKEGRAVFTGTVEQAIATSPCGTFEDAYLWYAGDEEENDARFS